MHLTSTATLLAALTLAGGAALPAQAQESTPQLTPSERMEQRIDRRQHRQARRIDAGLAQGQLTAGETRLLLRQQQRTQRMEDRIEADGRISRREAVRMEARLDRNSAAIARARHNNRRP